MGVRGRACKRQPPPRARDGIREEEEDMIKYKKDGYYKPSDIRKDGLLKAKKLKERDEVRIAKQQNEAVNPSPGQIWKENDPRIERYIFIVEIRIRSGKDMREGEIDFFTCNRAGCVQRGDHRRTAMMSRFNGKRGGYSFIEDGLKK